MQQLEVHQVAILGAGVMGAQIAAHFANCNFDVLLYDLPGRSSSALANLLKLKPSPLAITASTNNPILARIQPLDYDNNLDLLKSCDLIIEAVAENLEVKLNLYNQIKDYINNKAIFCSNTSGLSINKLAEILNSSSASTDSLSARFCGVHFFNPPRYQKLVELIPHNKTNPKVLDGLEEFFTKYLGKGVIRAFDTPNFIANRIGVFSMLSTMHNAKKYDLSLDIVDLLTGELIGRPKSATYRTADVVGLDTLLNVINTMYNHCLEDPWRDYLQAPDYLLKLINNGHLGQKTGKGFYFKNNKTIEVYDYKQDVYTPIDSDLVKSAKLDNNLLAILKIKNPAEKFIKLKNYDNPQAQFLWSCFRDLWQYSAYHLAEISGSVRDVDLALCWGFGWKIGPFELWQAIGWQEVAKLINQDVKNNQALVAVDLPRWVFEDLIKDGVYKLSSEKKSYNFYNINLSKFTTRSNLAVYIRQDNSGVLNQKIILENSDAKLWIYSNNLVFSFKTKANILTDGVISLLDQAIDYINHNNYNSLILWQDNNANNSNSTGSNFCAGADLNGFMSCVKAGDYNRMDQSLANFQNLCQKLRYANFPVVAAAQGMVLGGGCELLMHCDRVVAALETYIGLVEVGVGVIPAGGGCKEMLRRAHENYLNIYNNNGLINYADIDKITQQYYKAIATAQVSASAVDAVNLGYLKTTDTIIANPAELLNTAVSIANNLAYCNYQPPTKIKIKIGGARIWANIMAMLENYLAGNFISKHDYIITSKLADIFSGGGINTETDQVVVEQKILDLERRVFLDLLRTEATQARINSLLATGKTIRN